MRLRKCPTPFVSRPRSAAVPPTLALAPQGSKAKCPDRIQGVDGVESRRMSRLRLPRRRGGRWIKARAIDTEAVRADLVQGRGKGTHAHNNQLYCGVVLSLYVRLSTWQGTQLSKSRCPESQDTIRSTVREEE